MSRVTYTDFNDNYLVKDGDIGNEANLTRSPLQLKKEVDEVGSIVDILIGNDIQVWDSGTTYRIDEYVYYDGFNYKSLRETLNDVPTTSTADWELIDVSAVGGSGGSGSIDTKREDFISTENQAVFETASTLYDIVVYVEGVLEDTVNYSTSGNQITFVSGFNEGTLISVFTTARVPSEIIKGDTFTATENQTEFVTSFEFHDVVVYLNGVLQNEDTYYLGAGTITFNEGIQIGTAVRIFTAVPADQYDFDSSKIINVPSGDLTSTNMQAAVNELQTNINETKDYAIAMAIALG